MNRQLKSSILGAAVVDDQWLGGFRGTEPGDKSYLKFGNVTLKFSDFLTGDICRSQEES